MIDIKEKTDCCGCNACASICTKKAITMLADNEGFLYPSVNEEVCTNCGMCEKVCPIINQCETRTPLQAYAAKCKDENIRKKSSSGGIFTLLAEEVINEGGVVFGAKFNEKWNVVHDWTDAVSGIADFRGSKYVQSTIGESYNNAKVFLQQGRKVLFSGTPCQIAGLKRFLRKDYHNLLTVDIICHGVPSPLAWHEYLNEILHTNKSVENPSKDNTPIITDISFRDKSNGWKRYGFKLCYTTTHKLSDRPISNYSTKGSKVILQPFSENIFMKGFLADLYLRPSCHTCPARSGKSGSDITLGDFWGVNKFHADIDDDYGVSAVIAYTDKGVATITRTKSDIIPTVMQAIETKNPSLYKSNKCHRNRQTFFAQKTKSFSYKTKESLKPTLWERINQKWYKIKQHYRQYQNIEK